MTQPNASLKSLLSPANFPQTQRTANDHIHVELCYTPLDLPFASSFIRSPTAGANVLFLGTTRNSFDDRPVSHLAYQAYPQLALNTLSKIAGEVREKYGLEKVIIVHRLGEVPIEEESIIVGISSGHRGEGWRGAEEMLERVKERAEIWKQEWFVDVEGGKTESAGAGAGAGAVWKANRDTDQHGKLVLNGEV